MTTEYFLGLLTMAFWIWVVWMLLRKPKVPCADEI